MSRFNRQNITIRNSQYIREKETTLQVETRKQKLGEISEPEEQAYKNHGCA